MNKAMLDLIIKRVPHRMDRIKNATQWKARLYNTSSKEYVARFHVLAHNEKTAMVLLYPKEEYEVFCITLAYWNGRKKEWKFSDYDAFYNFEEKNEVKDGRGQLHITLGLDVITAPM